MPVLSKFMSFREHRYREKKKIRLAIMYMMMEMLDPVRKCEFILKHRSSFQRRILQVVPGPKTFS